MLKPLNYIKEVIEKRKFKAPLRRMHIHHTSDNSGVLSMERQVRQTFRLIVEARVTSPDEGRDLIEANRHAAEIIAHELYGDLRRELIELMHFAYEEGLGQDVEKKIARLIRLTEGGDPQD